MRVFSRSTAARCSGAHLYVNLQLHELDNLKDIDELKTSKSGFMKEKYESE